MTRRQWQDLARSVGRRMRAAVQLLDPRPHLRDAHVYGGLALAAAGGWELSPAWTKLGVGLVLVLFGVFVPRQPAAAAAAED
jgi:hypothetical protein